jgi:hypothetical protein
MSLLAITEVGDSSPTRHLCFAAFFYLIGVGFIVGWIVPGEMRYKRGGKMSRPALVISILTFFAWGTLSLASGLGHGISAGYDMGIRLGSLALCVIYSIYDRSAV